MLYNTAYETSDMLMAAINSTLIKNYISSLVRDEVCVEIDDTIHTREDGKKYKMKVGDPLDIIKKYGTKCAATDFAILLGATPSAINYINDALLTNRTCSWWIYNEF